MDSGCLQRDKDGGTGGSRNGEDGVRGCLWTGGVGAGCLYSDVVVGTGRP